MESNDPDVTSAVEIGDSPERARYEVTIGGRLAGVMTYRMDADRITLLHTEIVSAGRGLGLGARLAEHVLADARRRGLRVRAECAFMAGHIDGHPEHQDLLA